MSNFVFIELRWKNNFCSHKIITRSALKVIDYSFKLYLNLNEDNILKSTPDTPSYLSTLSICI